MGPGLSHAHAARIESTEVEADCGRQGHGATASVTSSWVNAIGLSLGCVWTLNGQIFRSPARPQLRGRKSGPMA